MTDETNGSGVGERECSETSPSVDWVPGVWADHEHQCVTHARDEHECACGAKWEIPDADDASERGCRECGPGCTGPAAGTGASGRLSEAERESLRAVMGDVAGHPFVSVVVEVERIVAARESAAATRARAEERERIAQAIEARATWADDGSQWRDGMEDAARIARGDV